MHPEYRDADYRDAIDAEIEKAKERITLLKAARDGHMLFSVSYRFQDHHNDDDVDITQQIWARDAKHAESQAGVNRDGHRYGAIIGWTTCERGIPIFNPRTGEVE